MKDNILGTLLLSLPTRHVLQPQSVVALFAESGENPTTASILSRN